MEIAWMIDSVEERVRDDGLVVIKHPDVGGQSRMTLDRRDFETWIKKGSEDFQAVLSARMARLDAVFESQTSLSVALAPSAGGSGGLVRGKGAKPVQIRPMRPSAGWSTPLV